MWFLLVLLLVRADKAIRWYAPFLADSGFGSEATSFLESLLPNATHFGFQLQAVNFAEPAQFDPPLSLNRFFRHSLVAPRHCLVTVCHSTPNFWATPHSDYPSWDRAARCPPLQSTVKVGRSMFETNALPQDWLPRLHAMDFIWVPTRFAYEIYTRAGLPSHKIMVVPEPVDTDFYSVNHCKANKDDNEFTFLSVFKWEERKGWKYLLLAFCTEFSPHEKVRLIIKTNSFHSNKTPYEHALLEIPQLRNRSHQVKFSPKGRISSEELRNEYYCHAHALVQPSLGEGWGRPHAEAAAMGLSVVYTNFSGPTEFLHDTFAFPVQYELTPVPELPGHLWAKPDVLDLQRVMRKVQSMSSSARSRVGQMARNHMQAHYSQPIVGALTWKLLAQYCATGGAGAEEL